MPHTSDLFFLWGIFDLLLSKAERSGFVDAVLTSHKVIYDNLSKVDVAQALQTVFLNIYHVPFVRQRGLPEEIAEKKNGLHSTSFLPNGVLNTSII